MNNSVPWLASKILPLAFIGFLAVTIGGCGQLSLDDLRKKAPPIVLLPAGPNSDTLIHTAEYLTPALELGENPTLREIHFGPDGTAAIPLPGKNKIHFLDPRGKLVKTATPASGYQFSGPRAFGRDNHFYAMDNTRGAILKYSATGEFIENCFPDLISSQEGKGRWSLFYPSDEYLYAVENGTGQVYRFDAKGEKSCSFRLEEGDIESQDLLLRLDDEQNMYFLDRTQRAAYKFDPFGKRVFKITKAGKENFGPNLYYSPTALDKFVVLDADRCRAHVFSGGGKYELSFGEKGSEAGQFKNPTGIAVDTQGNLYITDGGNHRVQIFDLEGNPILEFGQAEKNIVQPTHSFLFQDAYYLIFESEKNSLLAFTNEGQFKGALNLEKKFSSDIHQPLVLFSEGKKFLFAVNRQDARMIRYPESSEFTSLWTSLLQPPPTPGRISNVVFDSGGRLFFVNSASATIDCHDTNGKKLSEFKEPLVIARHKKQLTYSAMAANGQGVLVLADKKNHLVKKLNKTGGEEWVAGKREDQDGDGRMDPGKEKGHFNNPGPIRFLDDDTLAVGDGGNFRVQLLNPGTGSYRGSIGKKGGGEGSVSVPFEFAGTGGKLFLVEATHHRVQGFSIDGQFRFSDGQQGFDKEEFQAPLGCGLTTDGMLYIADSKPKTTPRGATFRVQILKCENLVEQAIEKLKTGDYGGAAPILTEITKTKRDDGDIRYYLGYCHLMAGEVEPAKDNFRVVKLKKSLEVGPLAEELLSIIKNAGW